MDPHSLDILEYEKVKAMLAGRAASSLGRAEVARLEPLTAVERVRLAIDETTELRRLLELRGRLPVGGMTDVRPAVAGTEGGDAALEPNALAQVRGTLLAALGFRRVFEEFADVCPRLAELGTRLGDFEPLCDRIEAVVDNDGTVRDDASPKLAQLRRHLEAATQRLRAKAYALAQSAATRPLLQSEQVSVRHGRYVLAVKVERKHQLDGIIHDRSQTGATVYLEPRDLVLLANELDDLRFDEQREVTRLLWELTFALREQREPILATLDALAWVDCTYAKARFSIDYAMSPPAINDAGHLDARRARHPILVQVLERDDDGPRGEVVPIDFRLGEDFDLLVITGPNTGGKTVSLKTIGLLALMAQSGMHVPCDPGAQFPVYTNILADIGDEQSIEQSLSTFSSHMTNIVRVLRKAHETTLVLLDELGAGTDPAEGAAIATAILDVLRRRKAKTVVTTHIGDLKAYAYRHPRSRNAACEFDQQTLQPTFRLLLGQPGNSNAVAIAARLGMPRGIVRRATGLLARRQGRDETGMIAELQRSRRAIEDDRETAHALRQEADAAREDAARELRAAKALARAARREAEQEIDEHVRGLRDRLRDALRQIRNAPAPFGDRVREIEALLDAEIERSPLAARRLAFARKLTRDDLVYGSPFGERCRGRTINNTTKRLQVVLGHALVEVSFDDVSWIDPPPGSDG